MDGQQAIRLIIIRSVPLQTRSCVLTCVPSSIVCRVKSISGTGRLSWTARWSGFEPPWSIFISTDSVAAAYIGKYRRWLCGGIWLRWTRVRMKKAAPWLISELSGASHALCDIEPLREQLRRKHVEVEKEEALWVAILCFLLCGTVDEDCNWV